MPTPMHVNVTLPVDRNGREIQVPRGSGSRVNLTAGASSSNAALPTNSQVVFVRCTADIWLNFGTSGVSATATASSILHPAGESVQVVPTGATHVAVLRFGATDVTVQVEKIDG